MKKKATSKILAPETRKKIAANMRTSGLRAMSLTGKYTCTFEHESFGVYIMSPDDEEAFQRLVDYWVSDLLSDSQRAKILSLSGDTFCLPYGDYIGWEEHGWITAFSLPYLQASIIRLTAN